jgi:hypothetical protein
MDVERLVFTEAHAELRDVLLAGIVVRAVDVGNATRGGGGAGGQSKSARRNRGRYASKRDQWV